MSGDEDEDVKLSPADVEKMKAARSAISQAQAALQDIDDDVREEYGDLEDALSKLEEIDDLIEGCMPEGEDNGGSGAAEGSTETA